MGQPTRRSRRFAFMPGAVLAATVALLFLPTTRNGFVFLDDADYITANPQVRSGLSVAGVRWAFFTFANGNWHPLTWISHLADVQLFGLDPAGHHLAGALLHAANAWLLFALLRRLTGAAAASWLAALLFSVHPLRVESVAWAAERKDVLSALFFLLALLAWTRYLGGADRRRWYCAALALFTLGLMAKPMVVTLPFVLLLLEWWPIGRFAGAGAGARLRFPARPALRLALVDKLPFFVLSLGSSVVTFVAQHQGRGLRSLDELPLGMRVANALDAPLGYLAQTLWPARLVAFSMHPLGGLPAWRPLLGAAALLAGLAFVALRGGRFPWIAVAWCWFLGTLVPVIGLVQVGAQGTADRYTYLPHIGLCLAIAGGTPFARSAGRSGMPSRRLCLVAGVFAAFLLGAATTRQIAVWKDSEALLRHAVDTDPDNPVAALNLAVLQGRLGRYADAEETYRGLFMVAPRWRKARYEHGILAVTTSDREAALADYKVLLELDPALADRLGRYIAAMGWRLPRR